jgi:hypothetical protein
MHTEVSNSNKLASSSSSTTTTSMVMSEDPGTAGRRFKFNKKTLPVVVLGEI